RSGDKDAYVEAAERFHREIWAYVYRLCGDRELAADICQETAIAVWRAAPEFANIKALRAWIYRVAHNNYVDHYRRSRTQVVALDDEVGAVTGDVLGEVVRRSEIEQALAHLPDHIRHAIILTKVQGLTTNEAAEVLEVPAGTVKWWVSE
ncbi:MAG: RNA polymerase sigma factor, partial [candidate division Zixibacteria bacterium]|nr:RNA polymerase sigma factor [candidate division Zixibacteria bacterium]